METGKTIKMPKTETEIAVLQVQVQNITNDISEIKADIKDVNVCIARNNEDTHQLLKEMKEASADAHKSMSDKVSALEKWRWMMMGAGVVIGSLGFDTIAKLLK
jgi:peptidoglycan hydrolase CwlO-like protein